MVSDSTLTISAGISTVSSRLQGLGCSEDGTSVAVGSVVFRSVVKGNAFRNKSRRLRPAKIAGDGRAGFLLGGRCQLFGQHNPRHSAEVGRVIFSVREPCKPVKLGELSMPAINARGDSIERKTR